MLNKNLVGYRLRYYEYAQQGLAPLISFMILDSEEIILVFYNTPFLSGEGAIRFAIKHPDILKLFKVYYDAIWEGAAILKEGDKANFTLLQEIRDRLSSGKDNKSIV